MKAIIVSIAVSFFSQSCTSNMKADFLTLPMVTVSFGDKDTVKVSVNFFFIYPFKVKSSLLDTTRF